MRLLFFSSFLSRLSAEHANLFLSGKFISDISGLYRLQLIDRNGADRGLEIRYAQCDDAPCPMPMLGGLGFRG